MPFKAASSSASSVGSAIIGVVVPLFDATVLAVLLISVLLGVTFDLAEEGAALALGPMVNF